MRIPVRIMHRVWDSTIPSAAVVLYIMTLGSLLKNPHEYPRVHHMMPAGKISDDCNVDEWPYSNTKT